MLCFVVQLTLGRAVHDGNGRVAFAIVLGVLGTMPLAAVRAGPDPIFKGVHLATAYSCSRGL